MYKTAAIACALVAASAQNAQTIASGVPNLAVNNTVVENLANQANDALAPLFNQQSSVVQHGDSLYINLNNYEWILTEFGNEFEFSVNELSFFTNDVEATLDALIINSGNFLQNNAESVANYLESEAASLGIVIPDQAALTQDTKQYGAQLVENANSLAAQASTGYNQNARNYANNKNGMLTNANQAIQNSITNPGQYSSEVSNFVASTLGNTGVNDLNVGNLANSVPSGIIPATLPNNVGGVDLSSLPNSASGANVLNSVLSNSNNLGSLASQSAQSGLNAVGNNVPSSLVSSAKAAINNGAVSTTVNNAVNGATNAAGGLVGNQ